MSWLVKNGKEDEACAEKAEAVALFESMLDEVAAMGFEQYQGPQRLKLSDSQLPARLRSSVGVGVRFFRAVQAAWDVAALGVKGDAAGEYNKTGLAEAALRYNASWAGYTGYLLSCPTVSIQAQLMLEPRLWPLALRQLTGRVCSVWDADVRSLLRDPAPRAGPDCAAGHARVRRWDDGHGATLRGTRRMNTS